jgi:hypothetical protein
VGNFLFENEFRIFGLKRSGMSAVYSFLHGHFEDNNIVNVNNSNLTLYDVYRKIDREVFENFEFRVKWFLSNYDGKIQLINIIEHMPIDHIGILMNPLYSYNSQRREWAYRFKKVAFSKKVYNIFVIRSFHNYLASLVKLGDAWAEGREEIKGLFYGSDMYMEIVEIWLQYAREILGITNYISDKIIILYDNFVSSKSYRVDISKKLNIPHNDFGIKFILRTKSSFSGWRYKDRAQDMKVLDRWKYFFIDDPKVWWLFEECKRKILHSEVIEYNKALFGIDLRECFKE